MIDNALISIVEQGAFALWALVVLVAVREIKIIRKYIIDKDNDDGNRGDKS